mmetsp:Transcript_107176/g.181041  ORF Transcript_107176/g.181041 Transcript_107176/m.181041 type:complete len:207 (-) Transcript_107176:620-1240(-)
MGPPNHQSLVCFAFFQQHSSQMDVRTGPIPLRTARGHLYNAAWHHNPSPSTLPLNVGSSKEEAVASIQHISSPPRHFCPQESSLIETLPSAPQNRQHGICTLRMLAQKLLKDCSPEETWAVSMQTHACTTWCQSHWNRTPERAPQTSQNINSALSPSGSSCGQSTLSHERIKKPPACPARQALRRGGAQATNAPGSLLPPPIESRR